MKVCSQTLHPLHLSMKWGFFGISHYCHPERSEGSRVHKAVDVFEILPPYGRLDDKKEEMNDIFKPMVNWVKG